MAKGNLKKSDLDEWIRQGKAKAGKSDGGGLTFTLSTAGTASWVFRYRHAGKQREMTLGNYPDMSLEKAREAARAARVMVDIGKDVAEEKRRAKAEAAAARTFREVAEDYLEGKRTIAASTRAEWRRYLDKDIYPSLGSRAIRDISVDDLRVLVKRVAQRGAPAVARRAFEIVSVVLTHAIAEGSATTNPCASLKVSAIIGEHAKRQRVMLGRDELAHILDLAPKVGRRNELMLKILLATCVRKGELVKARKTDLDLEVGLWMVPDEHSKTRKGYVIPLAPAVVAWFRELVSYSGDSEWLLPARNGAGRFTGEHMHERTINQAILRAQFGVREFTPHDLRSTARSHLGALGVDPITAERCLNHKVGRLVGSLAQVYDKHDYLDERRKALELWANLLVELETGKAQNVVALRPAA